MTLTDPLAALAGHYAAIPLTRAMDLRVEGLEGESLVLAAPLAANVNDKGCAFGGSLASLMTLAAWGWIEHALELRGVAADIYVKDSRLRYLAPVWSDFRALAQPGAAADPARFFTTLERRGKARLQMYATVPLTEGGTAASLEAEFVAMLRR